jgi:hypothetical protein
MHTTKINSAMTSAVAITPTGVNPSNVLGAQFVSKPIAAQTITGTLKAYIYCKEAATSNNFFPHMGARVVSGDGTTVRGTLIAVSAVTTGKTEMVAAANPSGQRCGGFTNPNSGETVGSVICQAGDRIVVEFGWLQQSTNAGNHQWAVWGDDQATDAPENNTDLNATTRNPWAELSFTVAFQSAGAYVHSGWGVPL